MALKIVRNDITKMQVEAIVNTANEKTIVGAGCDTAIYKAAGYEKLLSYRKEHIGEVAEGNSFITPGFNLYAKYIIHTVSPMFIDGLHGEEEKLRNCYRNSLKLVLENNIKSVAFPLISTGSFGYPKEEGLRIAVDEINEFSGNCDVDVYLVVYDNQSTKLGKKIYPSLESYIDSKYVSQHEPYAMRSMSLADEDEDRFFASPMPNVRSVAPNSNISAKSAKSKSLIGNLLGNVAEKLPRMGSTKQQSQISQPEAISQPEVTLQSERMSQPGVMSQPEAVLQPQAAQDYVCDEEVEADENIDYNNQCEENVIETADYDEQDEELQEENVDYDAQIKKYENAIQERMKHLSDTFSEYLLYLIQLKGMTNADVYKRAIIDKKAFSKIKNNPNYHPQKITALCLCVGAKLNLDETKDLLARAGYALSPCDKTDIIFSYFIENEIYDMIELDIQLEEYGLKCVIA